MRLKLMAFNVQDLFLKLAFALEPKDLAGLNEKEWQQLNAGDVPLKPLGHLFGLARVFEAEGPDVAMLSEVGGPDALATFNRLFLGNRYQPVFLPGNSNRNIESAFLVRRSLPIEFKAKSHRQWPVLFQYPHEADPASYGATVAILPSLKLDPPDARRLSRDVPRLDLYRVVDGVTAARPFISLLLAHLKSGYDSDGIDPAGRARRSGEARALQAIWQATKAELGMTVPVLIAGDLNSTAARTGTSDEMRWLYDETDLDDVLEVLKLPPYERITHITYYGSEGEVSQYDYILLPPELQARVVKPLSYVHRFRFDDQRTEMQLPGSLTARRAMPSDHYPVICTLDFR